MIRTAPRSRARMITDTARGELIKLLTLPALYLAVLGTWTVTLVVDAALIAAADRDPSGAGSALDDGLGPIGYARAGLLVLGVLAAASEYQGGQIRTSLLCVPRRTELLIVKAIALALISVPVAAVAVTASVLLARHAPATPAALARAVPSICSAALAVLLAAAVASLIRATLPAIAILLGYYFIIGPLIRALAPGSGYTTWLPGAWPEHHQAAVAWTLFALAANGIAFARRDA